jgi:hypothetical protein
MTRKLITLLAATAACVTLPAVASAQQGWLNINQRQAQLDQRIDVGVRNGQITASEAARLRAEFSDLARLEARYRMDGLSMNERADLDRRFDGLSMRIRAERADNDRYRIGDYRPGRWNNVNLNQRQAQFQQRLARATRDGRITRIQANNLRAEFRTIARLENQYRRGGLSARERADLDMRLDRLQTNFRATVNANQYAYGYNSAPNLFDWLFGLTG